ncbi:fibronectin type III domain-containing protein [Geomonas anaerohicana]|uniref:Fibronectin type III domain-containing protein n=1 Tax=Geomonas anaerohicana TaxID=2798583 RepID=A0ABS0YFA7_9BACT|nr:fibronectin type III domain-containing protein [Geomonas anaerohicana]MBJ6751005.1 fibronectin type III domain-containing protein [Geomonas anaerohicana]
MVPSVIPVTNNVFVMNHFADMNHHQLIGWLLDTATKQEQHPYHGKNTPDWVAGFARLREHAAALSQKEEAAKNKDIQAIKERDLERAATLESIHFNASYIVMRARHENDESLLHNVGHELKEKTKRTHTPTSVTRLPLKVTAKRGDEPGTLVLTIERDPGAGVYEVQFCKGAPAGEQSWQLLGNFKKVRIFVPDLERSGWYYFRVRSHGDNETSPWSMPVDIIVG